MYLFKRAIDGQIQDFKRMLTIHEVSVSDQDDMNLTPLHYAAWYNKPDIVEMLLRFEADVNARDKEDATPLHYAARIKQRFHHDESGAVVKSPSCGRVVRRLAEADADVNAQDCYGSTPLFLATVRGSDDAAEQLLMCSGIDVQKSDSRELTCLHMAAKYNRIEIARMLLREGAKVLVKDDEDMTPLHTACMEGNVMIAEMLLEASMKRERQIVNAVTIENETPLDLAVENGHIETIRLLLKYGASVYKACRANNSSPLHLAAANGNVEVARLLLASDSRLLDMNCINHSTPLHRAAVTNQCEVAKLLLDSGANLEVKDHYNFTPLLTAAYYGSAEVIKLLLERDANLTALNKADRSVIHISVRSNKLEVLEIVLARIRDEGLLETMISSDDRLGNSPLHIAAKKNLPEMTRVLLQCGADIHNRNEDEETALHVAAKLGHIVVVEELLETHDKSVINDEDENSATPLHLAAEMGHHRVVEMLIKCGADITNRNRLGWIPLASAADNGWVESASILIEAGSEIDTADRVKRIPIHLAAAKGHAHTVQLLLENNCPVWIRDKDGNNALDLAIDFGHKHVATVIIQSNRWQEALMNRQNDGHFITTPIRKLIKSMPDVAAIVFDRCISYQAGKDRKDADLQIEFNYQFVDDTYSCAGWDSKYSGTRQHMPHFASCFDSVGRLHPDAQPYTPDSNTRVLNHPLTAMVKSKRADLLYHPLILALMRHKWKMAKYSYFTFLVYYLFFVALFTGYMVLNKPPFLLNETMVDPANVELCKKVVSEDLGASTFAISVGHTVAAGYIIWVLAAAGAFVELVQLYNTRVDYLWNPTNMLDWFTYVTASTVVVPVHPCGIRTPWQWQLGAMCMFVAWINLILFLRRLPRVGLYIVMVGEVFVTFAKFFIFCFSMFIFAFGFTFHILLRNQEPFKTPTYSFVKTGVMMIGEVEYESLFHEETDHKTAVYYEPLTFGLFLVFLCMMTIIIMNLLTGLAVGDVQEIQDHARFKKLAMQVELALDVEMSLPETLRRKFNTVVAKQLIWPNKVTSNLYHKLSRLMSGPLSAKAIASALFHDSDDHEDEERRNKEQEVQEFMSTWEEKQQELSSQLNQTTNLLRTVVGRLNHIERKLDVLSHRAMSTSVDFPKLDIGFIDDKASSS